MKIAKSAMIFIALIGHTSCSMPDPAQTNMFVKFDGESAGRVVDALSNFSQRNHLKLQVNEADFGGPGGSQKIFSVFDKGVMVRLQSSIDDPCMSGDLLSRQRQGYPVFSESLFFVSIFSRSISGNDDKVGRLASDLRDVLTKHGAVVSDKIIDCEATH